MLLQTLQKPGTERDKKAGSRGQEPWKISLGSLALRPFGEFWKVLEASPEVAAQRLGSCSPQGPPEPLRSQSKHQSLCSLSLMTTAMGEQLLLPRRLSVASP